MAELIEAMTGAPTGRKFRARLIAGDIQGSSGYYPAATLKRDGPTVFTEGLPVYLDHPSLSEAVERPERSVRDLAGRLASTAVYEKDGLYADVEVYPHWADVIEAMAGDIGMSIRACGVVSPSQDEAIAGPIVTSLTEASSVDFVTAAGAGGKVIDLLESARRIDAPPAAAEPTNVPAPPAKPTTEGVHVTDPGKGAPDGGATNLSEAARLRTELDDARTQLADAKLAAVRVPELDKALTEAKTELETTRREVLQLRADHTARTRAEATLAESTLPKVVCDRIVASVTGANTPLTEAGALDEVALTEAITKAVESERVYIARVAEATGMGTVRGMGGTDGPSEAELDKELARAFGAMGLSESAATRAAAGRG